MLPAPSRPIPSTYHDIVVRVVSIHEKWAAGGKSQEPGQTQTETETATSKGKRCFLIYRTDDRVGRSAAGTDRLVIFTVGSFFRSLFFRSFVRSFFLFAHLASQR